MWHCIPGIPALGRLREEACEFQGSPGYRAETLYTHAEGGRGRERVCVSVPAHAVEESCCRSASLLHSVAHLAVCRSLSVADVWPVLYRRRAGTAQ